MESIFTYVIGTLVIALAVVLKIFFNDFTEGLARQIFKDRQMADSVANTALFVLILLGFLIILLRYLC